MTRKLQDRNIAVLMGGFSSEKSISIETGQAVLGALLSRGYNAMGIYVDRDLDLSLRQNSIDVAFLALHGRYGEDGCIQGMLEIMGIPYTGSDVLAAALTMHKGKSKELFAQHHLSTPRSYCLDIDRVSEIHLHHGDLGFPVIVKPIAEGSSVGVTLAHNFGELRNACDLALQYDCEILVEAFVQGQEISVAVLEDRALGAIEICLDAQTKDFYDFAAKYDSTGCHYYIPPRVSPKNYRDILAAAEKAHRVLGCSGATRVDMIVSHEGVPHILEVNATPGLTPSSLLPKIAHGAGLSFEDLVEAIVGGARLATVDRGSRDRRTLRRVYRGDERRETNSEFPC